MKPRPIAVAMLACALLLTGCDQFFLGFARMGAYALRWEENGGSTIADQTTSLVSAMPISVRTGYALEGWYTEPGLVNKLSFPYDPTADLTLYAKWIAASEGLIYSANSTGYSVSNNTAQGAVTIPSYWLGKPVNAIDSWGFSYGNYTGVSIPSGVTSIGSSAFKACTGFGTIVLPAALTSIGVNAFNGSALASVTIPANVRSIGSGAFYNCTSLTTVTVEAATPPEIETNTFYTSSNAVPAGLSIAVPAASVAAYKTAVGWSIYGSKIVSQ